MTPVSYVGKCQICGYRTEPYLSKSQVETYMRDHEEAEHRGWKIETWWDWKLDDLLPTIADADVPAGTPLYSPSPDDILAYVNGKWWRKVRG